MVSTTSLSWLARRDGTEGTISGDEIPGGLDNIFQRLSARKLDDFEATSYVNDSVLRLEWGVDGGSTNIVLSSSGNAISGDSSLEITADGSTAAVARTFLHSQFGRVYPGGSKPSWSVGTNTGSYFFGPIRGIRFRMTASTDGTIHVIVRNGADNIHRKWNKPISADGTQFYYVDFGGTPDATTGTWDETAVDRIAFGNLQNGVTYRLDDVEFVTEANIQDILYETWKLSGSIIGSGGITLNRSFPETIEEDVTGSWRLEFYDPSGDLSVSTSEILPGTYVLERVRGTSATTIVTSTAASEAAGVIYVDYTPPNATFDNGDLIKITFTDIVIRGTPSTRLTSNAVSSQDVVLVADTSIFIVGQEVNIYSGTVSNGERFTIASIDSGTRLTLSENLTNTYTTVATATICKSTSFDPIVLTTNVVDAPSSALVTGTPRAQELIIYLTTDSAGTTEISDDGTSPPYFPASVHSTTSTSATAALTKQITVESEGTITVSSMYVEAEWQTAIANAASTTTSKMQISGNGGGAWVDVTDDFAHQGTSIVASTSDRIRAGSGKWLSTISTGANQLRIRLVHQTSNGSHASTAQLRSSSYIRLTYLKS